MKSLTLNRSKAFALILSAMALAASLLANAQTTQAENFDIQTPVAVSSAGMGEESTNVVVTAGGVVVTTTTASGSTTTTAISSPGTGTDSD